jgi:hypothetical protein
VDQQQQQIEPQFIIDSLHQSLRDTSDQLVLARAQTARLSRQLEETQIKLAELEEEKPKPKRKS